MEHTVIGRRPYTITVPTAGRRFRVLGYSPADAELTFALSVSEGADAIVRPVITDIRFPHEQLNRGQLRIEPIDRTIDSHSLDMITELK